MSIINTPGNRGRPTRKRVESPFAANLKQKMIECRFNYRGIAKMAGVSPSVIHAWVNGGQPHDFNAVARLAHGLKCDFQWLLTGSTSQLELKTLSLTELFDIKDEPALSGIFLIEAKRLRRRT